MLVVGCNLTIDRTLHLARLIPGAVQRPTSAVASAGGKAVNVCRAAQAHGIDPLLVANLPGRLGAVAGDLLEAEGLHLSRVPTSGEIRSAIVILEDDLRTTVLNEPGPILSAEDRRDLLDAVARAATSDAAADGVLVASGSLPPGEHAADLYADIVELGHRAGLRVVLDAARHDLAAALPAEPDIVTPNLSEALGVLGRAAGHPESVEPDSGNPRATATEAAAALVASGARAALVTAGRHGVAAATATTAFWLPSPVVTEVNPIGAGDAFVGGLASALARGADLHAATRVAVATGAASVATGVAGVPDRQLLAGFLAPTPGGA